MKTRQKAETIAPAPGNASFMDSSDGRGQRLSFARYHVSPMSWSGYGSGFASLSNPAHRDRSLAAAVTSEQIVANPTLATIIETLTTHTVGTGLRVDSRVCANEIGVTEDEAHVLAETIERKWEQYASKPLECDLTARFTVHEMAVTAFISWLCTGESLASIDWAPTRDTETGTKVALLEPRQIEMITRTDANGNVFQGVEFDARGRIAALWLRRTATGDTSKVGTSERVPMFTSWGRHKLIFLIEQLFPGQIRGLSTLVAALGPSQDRLMLQETTVASQALQAAYAITLESQLPPAQALGGLVVSEDGYDPLAAREKWYEATGGVKINPGTVNVLAAGDSLKMNRPNGLSGDYGEFNAALVREASRAAGALVKDISGDFSKTSFSASRLAVELPYRITLRRRKMIVERFYRAIFEAWCEEQIERGFIQLPPHAKLFQQARSAYTNAVWLGSGRVEADRKKAAEATALELSMGLTTFAEACSDRGLSFEAILEQRVQEQKALEASGLLGKSIFPAGRVTTQVVDQDGVEGEPKDGEGDDKESTNE